MNRRHLGAPCRTPSATSSPPKPEPELPQGSVSLLPWDTAGEGAAAGSDGERSRLFPPASQPLSWLHLPPMQLDLSKFPLLVHPSVAEKHHREFRIWGMLSMPSNEGGRVSCSAPSTWQKRMTWRLQDKHTTNKRALDEPASTLTLPTQLLDTYTYCVYGSQGSRKDSFGASTALMPQAVN